MLILTFIFITSTEPCVLCWLASVSMATHLPKMENMINIILNKHDNISEAIVIILSCICKHLDI